MRLLQWSNVESILFSNSWPSYVPISRWCRRPPPFKSFLARHQAPLNLSASFVSNVVFDAHETSFRAQFYNPPSPPSFFSLSLVPKCRARSLVSSSPPFSPDCPFQPLPPLSNRPWNAFNERLEIVERIFIYAKLAVCYVQKEEIMRGRHCTFSRRIDKKFLLESSLYNYLEIFRTTF